MEEELRISNKIARDVTERGKTREQVIDSIVSREYDSNTFIQPQRQNADLVIEIVARENSEIEVKFTSRNPSFAGRLFEILEEFGVSDKNFSIEVSGQQTVGVLPGHFQGRLALQVLESKLMNFNQMFEEKPSIPDGYQGLLAMVVFLAIDWEKGFK